MVVWSFPTKIVFGVGAAALTGEQARGLPMSRALVVTDEGVVKAGLADPIVQSLEAAGVATAVFSGVHGNPTEDDVDQGAAAYLAHRADGVVSLGGGSPLDVGKLVALRSEVGIPFAKLDDAIGGDRLIPPGLPPIITLPTTAGTGSEVGRSGVVTLRSTGRKTVIFSPNLLARVAILDPELTRTMPPKVTAATGFDALTHCIESYLALGDHPLADSIALGGIELVATHLRRAVENGNDLDARGAMMKAAMMGAIAFQKGLGACHSLAHPLSSEHGVHHGLANALCLPAVIDFNEEAVPKLVHRVGALLGAAPQKGACARALLDLRASVGLPAGLGPAGVPRASIPKLTDLAIVDQCHQTNPRKCSRDDLLRLYEASF